MSMTKTEEAGKKFEAILLEEQSLNHGKGEHRGLHKVLEAGWVEIVSDNRWTWNFMHHEYPGVYFAWRFGRDTWCIRAHNPCTEEGEIEEWNGENHSYWPTPVPTALKGE